MASTPGEESIKNIIVGGVFLLITSCFLVRGGWLSWGRWGTGEGDRLTGTLGYFSRPTDSCYPGTDPHTAPSPLRTPFGVSGSTPGARRSKNPHTNPHRHKRISHSVRVQPHLHTLTTLFIIDTFHPWVRSSCYSIDLRSVQYPYRFLVMQTCPNPMDPPHTLASTTTVLTKHKFHSSRTTPNQIFPNEKQRLRGIKCLWDI